MSLCVFTTFPVMAVAAGRLRCVLRVDGPDSVPASLPLGRHLRPYGLQRPGLLPPVYGRLHALHLRLQFQLLHPLTEPGVVT